jgi:hypothetical protein
LDAGGKVDFRADMIEQMPSTAAEASRRKEANQPFAGGWTTCKDPERLIVFAEFGETRFKQRQAAFAGDVLDCHFAESNDVESASARRIA